jgi:hypothetical protein
MMDDTTLFNVLILDERLIFDQSHANFVSTFANLTGLGQTDCYKLYKLLENYSIDGFINISTYRNFVCREFSSSPAVLHRFFEVYEMFNEGNMGRVSVIPLAVALSFFCSGAKSYKLSFAFELHKIKSKDLDGIQVFTLSSILHYYLKILVYVFKYDDLESVIQYLTRNRDKINKACSSICAQINIDIKNNDGCISFENFGNWYNYSGYMVVPWLELLNISKWESAPAYNTSQSASTNISSTSIDDIAFSIVMYTNNSSWKCVNRNVSKFAAYSYCRFARSFKLEPEVVILFLEYADDGLLSLELFNEAIITLTKNCATEDSSFFRFYKQLFYAFDRAGNSSVVDATEIAIGFTVIVQGSKSSKLALAFDMLDKNKSGYISKRDTWRLFRSFLCTLLVIQNFFVHDNIRTLASKELFILDSASAWLCDSVFYTIDSEQNMLSFDELAAWYHKVGWRICSWLECLDKKKWEFITNDP